MKRITMIICAIFAIATIGCHNTEDANEKIDECLEEEYGEDVSDETKSQWELDCEDGDDNCDECVDCVMDVDCDDFLEGSCSDECK
ncbi:MAG: hypothetical protein GY845_18395 [Planctomycetes bacterium]|nr:hypothetical protein [Planctomycetota bacterium]